MPRHGLAVQGTESPTAMPQASGRGMASWPIRRKLVALVTVPVLVIIGAGALMTISSIGLLRQAERARTLATTALAANVAIVAIDNELNQTITVVRTKTQPGTTVRVAPAPGAQRAMDVRRKDTDVALADLRTYLGEEPLGGWSSDVMLIADDLPTTIEQLTKVRGSADSGYSPLVLDQNYEQNVLAPLRGLVSALSRDIATATGTGDTVDQASTLNALANASFAASDERVRGTIALQSLRLSAQGRKDLSTQAIAQDAQLNIAFAHASPSQQAAITALRTDDFRIEQFRGDLDDLAAASALDATKKSERQEKEALLESISGPENFSAATGQRLGNLDTLIGQVAQDTRDKAAGDVRTSLLRTIGIAGLSVLTLLLVFAALAAIARTVTVPMRRLRSGAVEVATARLPAAVRQIEQQGVDAHIDLPPVLPPGLVAGPETVEVAHAVDGLTAEAVRLATSQVRLRHALDEAFVSMSRRSQSMVEKQLSIIDELESVEEDPEQLRNLFRLDHLAARMRRYNDNLLVLAGSSVRTRSNTPVPIADVFRAATSEMEQYERVRLQPVSSAAVAGQVAGGLIHLLAELLDNAAMYSPPTSPILLTANFTPNGGLHLEVTDSGVGIPPAELAELNARLSTPGTIDTQIPSRMGLFVVGRLAHRGGFEVRLSPRPTGAGTVAEVVVPPQHVAGGTGNGKGTEAPRLPHQAAPDNRPAPTMGAPAASMPATAGLSARQAPAGNLPPQPAQAWPPAGAQAPAGEGGNLPSRVPGAALSSGPLGGSAPAPPEPTNRFDAFGTENAPPSPEQTSTSSATALWAPRGRGEGPGAGTPPASPGATTPAPFGLPAPYPDDDPFGLGPVNGRNRPGDGDAPFGGSGPDTPGGPFDGSGGSGGSPFGGGSGGSGGAPFGGGSGNAGGTPFGGGSGNAGGAPFGGASGSAGALPFGDIEQSQTRAPFGASGPEDPTSALGVQQAPPSDPWAGQTLPRRDQAGPGESAVPSSPAPLFGEASRPGGEDAGGVTLPVERMAPLTGELSLRDIAKAGSNPTLPPPSEFGGGTPGDPFSGIVDSEATTRFDRGDRDMSGSEPSPMEQEARDAASTRYQPIDPHAPMIGNLDHLEPDSASTPIFDSISLWFNDDTAEGSAESEPSGLPSAPQGVPQETIGHQDRMIDLRNDLEPATPPASGDLASRWASLGDQQWLATNARAAAQPEVAGDTSAGLPRRQPGANLLPSATSAAPSTTATPAPFRRADADTVRGRLGSYQQGVSSARRTRQIPMGGTAAGLFTAARTSAEETGREPEDHGGQE
ncbi:MAG: ATP-binding protein [Kineosporiaceae bacterium]